VRVRAAIGTALMLVNVISSLYTLAMRLQSVNVQLMLRRRNALLEPSGAVLPTALTEILAS
jgi:hypothetical protein